MTDFKTHETRIDVAIHGASLLGTRAYGEVHPEDPYLDASQEVAEYGLDEAVRRHAFRLGMVEPQHIGITDAMVEAFGEAWHATPEGEPGDRRRAALSACLGAWTP